MALHIPEICFPKKAQNEKTALEMKLHKEEMPPIASSLGIFVKGSTLIETSNTWYTKKHPAHPHKLPWVPQVHIHWGLCLKNLGEASWALSEDLASSCTFTFRISEKGKDRWVKSPDHVLRKMTDIEGTCGWDLHLYHSEVFHVLSPFWGALNQRLQKHLIYPSCLMHSLITSKKPQAHHSALPSPQFSALERRGWLLVSKGWEMVLLQQVNALGAHSHSCTSQISESRGGSFLSCSRRAKTCSEWTLLRVRRLTSFINIRGNMRWSCRVTQIDSHK